MAKVFLDANILVDILEARKDTSFLQLDKHEVCASTLSIHIMFYVGRKRVPYPIISEMFREINLISLSEEITEKALTGPTTDFEDNVQLHSAAEAECDYFLTNDSKLLKMKFFGKVALAPNLTNKK